MVSIEVTIENEMEFLTRVYCRWNDIFGMPRMERIEIRNDQIPELIRKLKDAYESTGVIDVTPKILQDSQEPCTSENAIVRIQTCATSDVQTFLPGGGIDG